MLPAIPSPPLRKSHLPAWLLASTAAVESSQNERGILEDRIHGLKKDVLVLETLMDKEKSSYATVLAARANAALVRKAKGAEECQQNSVNNTDDIPRRALGLHILPVDMANLVSQYGGAKELAVFSIASKETYLYMAQDDAGWAGLYRQHSLVVWDIIPSTDLRMIPNVSKKRWMKPLFPVVKPTATTPDAEEAKSTISESEEWQKVSLLTIRGQVLHHAAGLARVITFLKHLQQTRSSRRTTDIKPKVYSRRDRDVSHPLPFISVGGSLGDKIMSQANSMNKDTRQEALSALEIMVMLSANKLDQCSLSLLRRMGAITVMVALLANESASVQELAAASLANLMIRADLEGPLINDIDPHIALGRCSGRNPLVALLTSPTARVNTITTMPPSVATDGTARNSWVIGSRQTTTFCMGMASKHASRALINVWCPRHAVASSMFEDATSVPWNTQGNNEEFWMAYYYYSTGTEKDSSPIQLDIQPSGDIQGSGFDNLGEFVLKGKVNRMGSLTYNFTKTFTDRGNIPADGHISHVAFWAGSGGTNGASYDDSGFWGIWEHVTGAPHFELDKGGVFRFVPVINGPS